MIFEPARGLTEIRRFECQRCGKLKEYGLEDRLGVSEWLVVTTGRAMNEERTFRTIVCMECMTDLGRWFKELKINRGEPIDISPGFAMQVEEDAPLSAQEETTVPMEKVDA